MLHKPKVLAYDDDFFDSAFDSLFLYFRILWILSQSDLLEKRLAQEFLQSRARYAGKLWGANSWLGCKEYKLDVVIDLVMLWTYPSTFQCFGTLLS